MDFSELNSSYRIPNERYVFSIASMWILRIHHTYPEKEIRKKRTAGTNTIVRLSGVVISGVDTIDSFVMNKNR